ncbi:MAG: hypothetical protein IKS10_06965 [Lachnospiraceae bacterium]|nr:hypothetical protein [Lachnospiraceae bacterium]
MYLSGPNNLFEAIILLIIIIPVVILHFLGCIFRSIRLFFSPDRWAIRRLFNSKENADPDRVHDARNESYDGIYVRAELPEEVEQATAAQTRGDATPGTRIKARLLLFLVSALPLVLASVFVAKLSSNGSDHVVFEAAVLITATLLLKTLVQYIFKCKTRRIAGCERKLVLDLLSGLVSGAECVILLCIWKEIGLGALVVYIFGGILDLEVLWMKAYAISDGSRYAYLERYAIPVLIGTVAFEAGVPLCIWKMISSGIRPFGTACVLGYGLLQILKAIVRLFLAKPKSGFETKPETKDPTEADLEQDTKPQAGEPDSWMCALLIGSPEVTKLKDVALRLVPLAVATAAWGIFANFSLELFSEGMDLWTILLFVCIASNAFVGGRYTASFRRILSLVGLIPAFILLWPTIEYVSIWGTLLMGLGYVMFRWYDMAC